MTQLLFVTIKPHLTGRLAIGDFRENFVSSSAIMDADAYREHWKSAVNAFDRGKDQVIVTSWEPSQRPDGISGRGYLFYWIEEGEVAIQESLLVNSLYFENPSKPTLEGLRIPKRETHSEGELISEWTATRWNIADLCTYLSV